jgi:hypothetical protein
MKKSFLLMLVLSATLAHAQVYFRTGGGYALPMATETIGENHHSGSVIESAASGDNSSEQVKGSYGAGVNFGVGGGYRFGKYFGVDLDIRYLAGNSIKTEEAYTEYTSPGVIARRQVLANTYRSSALFITPSFVLMAGSGSKEPYARFGAVIGRPKIKHEYTDASYTGENLNTPYHRNGSSKGEYSGPSFGFQSAIGMNWTLSDKFNLYTELNFTSMTWYPKEFNLTEVIDTEGYNIINQMSLYNKKTEFRKKIDLSNEPSQTQPMQAINESKPFSSVSFQVGVSYLLGGRKLAD